MEENKNIENNILEVAGFKESMKGLNECITMLSEDIHLGGNNMQKPIQQQQSASIPNKPVKTHVPEESPVKISEPVSEKAIHILNSIRRLALDGIRELADNPTSDEYLSLKKIWDLTDKAQNLREKPKVE